MSLAIYMIAATIGVFALGAAFALAWSVEAGQWKHLAEGARIVLDDDMPAGGEFGDHED